MWYIISRLNKQSYDYNNILSEHKEICGKIKEQRKRERVRKNFNSWQVWCIANKRLPKASSEDKYEEHLYHQMCRDLKFIKQDFENCSDILKEYEKLICEYKISIR